MTFDELQKHLVANVSAYSREHKIPINEEFMLLKMMEEMGEFSQAVLIHRKLCRPEKRVSLEESKKEIAKELADVIGMAIVTAHMMDVDIEQALIDKWINNGSLARETNT